MIRSAIKLATFHSVEGGSHDVWLGSRSRSVFLQFVVVLSSLVSHGLDDIDLLGGITILGGGLRLSLNHLFSSSFALFGGSSVLGLSEFAIRVGITSSRSLGVSGTSSGLGFSLSLTSTLVRKSSTTVLTVGAVTLEFESSPLVRSLFTSLPRFVEIRLSLEVLGISSSLISPSDLLLGVSPLGVELSNGLRLGLSLTFSRGFAILSSRRGLSFGSRLRSGGCRFRCILSFLLNKSLSPDTGSHVVEGGSSLRTISVSTILVNFGFKYLHFVGLFLGVGTPGGDGLIS